MTKVVVVKEDGTKKIFKNTVGHQIGNGAVQVMMTDGSQRVYNNFKEVYVDLDADDKKAFKLRMEAAEAAAKAQMAANDAQPIEASNVIALDS